MVEGSRVLVQTHHALTLRFYLFSLGILAAEEMLFRWDFGVPRFNGHDVKQAKEVRSGLSSTHSITHLNIAP